MGVVGPCARGGGSPARRSGRAALGLSGGHRRTHRRSDARVCRSSRGGGSGAEDAPLRAATARSVRDADGARPPFAGFRADDGGARPLSSSWSARRLPPWQRRLAGGRARVRPACHRSPWGAQWRVAAAAPALPAAPHRRRRHRSHPGSRGFGGPPRRGVSGASETLPLTSINADPRWPGLEPAADCCPNCPVQGLRRSRYSRLRLHPEERPIEGAPSSDPAQSLAGSARASPASRAQKGPQTTNSNSYDVAPILPLWAALSLAAPPADFPTSGGGPRSEVSPCVTSGFKSVLARSISLRASGWVRAGGALRRSRTASAGADLEVCDKDDQRTGIPEPTRPSASRLASASNSPWALAPLKNMVPATPILAQIRVVLGRF